MGRQPPILHWLALSILLILLAGCQPNASPTPTAPPEPAVTPDAAFPTPAFAQAEEPLQGSVPDIPSVLIVGARQSKDDLAGYLKTTVPNLEWVNPGLDDPALPGTLVVIPSVYRATQGETLSGIAAQTGLPEHELLAANPGLDAQAALGEGALLALPSLVIMPDDTLLSAAAGALATTDDALLSANPHLAGADAIRAGTLLVVPAERRQAP